MVDLLGVKFMNYRIEAFMQMYMYYIEKVMSSRLDEIRDISFHSDEANTDRELKIYFKKTNRN